jgi:hypothetical protein
MAVTTTQYITGGTHTYRADSGVFEHTVALTAATVTTGGAVAAVANPLGIDLIVTRAILNVTTQSTGAATVDIGVATNGTTSADNLLDGKTVAAAGLFDNLVAADAGTNGKTIKTWSASQYVTATASATVAGLVGTLTLICVRA